MYEPQNQMVGTPTASAQREVSRTEIEIKSMDEALAHLGGKLDVLVSRLEPIMLPPEPQKGTDTQSQPPEPLRSPVAHQFYTQRRSVESMIGVVEVILNRLDLS